MLVRSYMPSPLLCPYSSPLPSLIDLVLLACNWSAMGDSFFVCHHLAALYAYGYVLVSYKCAKCSGSARVCFQLKYRYALQKLHVD